jgi:hypothetical protein
MVLGVVPGVVCLTLNYYVMGIFSIFRRVNRLEAQVYQMTRDVLCLKAGPPKFQRGDFVTKFGGVDSGSSKYVVVDVVDKVTHGYDGRPEVVEWVYGLVCIDTKFYFAGEPGWKYTKVDKI